MLKRHFQLSKSFEMCFPTNDDFWGKWWRPCIRQCGAFSELEQSFRSSAIRASLSGLLDNYRGLKSDKSAGQKRQHFDFKVPPKIEQEIELKIEPEQDKKWTWKSIIVWKTKSRFGRAAPTEKEIWLKLFESYVIRHLIDRQTIGGQWNDSQAVCAHTEKACRRTQIPLN